MSSAQSPSADRYFTIESPSEGLFKAKGSKHLGYVFPVSSKEEIEHHLQQLRKLHHSARHHCYAYRLGAQGEVFRSNDDGEPNNSAGPPILGALRSKEVTNCLAVVVRYFGGTKLGVGGLIEAYREATFAALDQGQIVERFIHTTFKISFSYAKMGEVMSQLNRWSVTPDATDFTVSCSLEASVRQRDADAFAQSFDDPGIQVQALRTK